MKKKNSKYQHLFFDLDRTLWDFKTNSREVLQELHVDLSLHERGVTEAEEFVHRYEAINRQYWIEHREGRINKEELRRKRFQDALGAFGILDEKLAVELDKEYISRCPKKNRLLPYAKEVLTELTQKYSLHLITNGFEETQRTKLEYSGLMDFFGEVITSESAQAKKPDPRIFGWSLKLTGANADNSLMIGDDLEADIGGARGSGIDQVFLNPQKKPHKESVTYEITCLSQLKKILW